LLQGGEFVLASVLTDLFSALRMPVQDERDGGRSAFVHGEIDKESLAGGGHGVLLLARARQRAAGDADRKQNRGVPVSSGRPSGDNFTGAAIILLSSET
jgi:hypothetical protein